MDLTETAAVVYRSVVALGSLAVPARFRFERSQIHGFEVLSSRR